MSIHIPARGGVTTWVNSDIYTTILTAGSTGGSLGMVRATVPPGGGPPPHVHAHSDEVFYLIDGDLQFLDGERTLTVGAGEAVFLPRGTKHGFSNPGIFPATLLFMFTPGGPEGLFVEGGDEPQPGVQVQPWGPERIDERMLALWSKYDTVLPPEQS